MVELHLDRRLSPRLDASDVVQEALADAAEKLGDYLRDRPLPFYQWLHRLATERLARAHRHHVTVRARSVGREQKEGPPLSDDSARRLADRLADSGTSPSQRLLRDELRQRLQAALDRMAPNDREVLVMCYLEGLGFGEIAAALGISENAAKVRHFRAMKRIREQIDREVDGETRP
jgi:RNA polymerase sigma-70 factor (ECF subfamily)